jgi:BirA family biotin operon repressor/biotin-[acetyl-CoA-carboxylase] ligase
MEIGSNLIFIENLTSTNTYSLGLLKKKSLPEGTVVYTNYQKGGRGQKGNQWESEKGKNLLISIILYPTTIDPSDQFIISKAISLWISDFLMDHISNITIKWPNDIYAGNDKIAGILIENTLLNDKIENTIVGIGININQVIFGSDAPNPVSLAILTGNSYDLKDCLKGLLKNLDKRYKQLLSKKYYELDSDYISRLYRYRKWYMFRDINKTYEGRIISLTPDGRLQVEEQNGSVNDYSFGEVDFIL